jgi:hypothetical protein
MTRKYTDLLLEMIANNELDRDLVILACVKYIGDREVRNMMEFNKFIKGWESDPEDDEYARGDDGC